MRRLTTFISLLALLAGCNTEIEQERNCRLTSDGWVCRDAGQSEPDSGSSIPDVSNSPDMPQMQPREDMSGPVPDMTVEEDSSNTEAASSCADLLLRGEATGQHTIELNGAPTDVYCDMDTANGGWMLVARSVAGGASGSFGWRSSTGGLDDTTQPYSLGPVDFGFTEMLIGAHEGGYGWGDRVYQATGINNFWSSCQNTACNVSVTPVAGNCNEIVMLSFAGFNEETGRFFFRDLAEISTQGLYPDGFQVFYDDCQGGELEGRQGMIFVR